MSDPPGQFPESSADHCFNLRRLRILSMSDLLAPALFPTLACTVSQIEDSCTVSIIIASQPYPSY